MVLKKYVEVTKVQFPLSFQGIALKYQFSKAIDQLFNELDKTKNQIQLDSKNNPMSLPVYSVMAEVSSLYNSKKDDLVMLQELFERLEEIRDNEQRELAARWYAEELHNSMITNFDATKLTIVHINYKE